MPTENDATPKGRQAVMSGEDHRIKSMAVGVIEILHQFIGIKTVKALTQVSGVLQK